VKAADQAAALGLGDRVHRARLSYHLPLSSRRFTVRTLAQAAYLDSAFDADIDLPHAGSALENPYVYDAAARELKAMADKGLLAIVAERQHAAGTDDETLIRHLRFRRLR
jgi:hypothetical protein